MWPFSSRALFPPPTEAWLQRVLSDPEAQGWGAWSQTEKTPLEPEYGDRKEEEETGKEEDNEEDSDFPLFLLEIENLPEDLLEDLPKHPVPDQELEAIKLNLWAVEQAQEPELPRAQGRAGKEEGAGSVLAPQLRGCPCPEAPVEKAEADPRSIYVGNVDYESTAEELEAYFNLCGEVQRVSIPCNKFSGHPKGYAYIEFATESSAHAAVGLDQSVFRGRVIKVMPKKACLPGISSTDRGGLQGHPGARGTPRCQGGTLLLQQQPPERGPLQTARAEEASAGGKDLAQGGYSMFSGPQLHSELGKEAWSQVPAHLGLA
ncbi:embryonic polyadenylate-binding protein 2 [Phyllostomus discolor]|uniref:Embryonic polyadenylate-binding protein 2 n=1 Tax=Phyllostomus discolor TaxID=89673 RepID=A0A7E6CTR9_9CHIR|nr:embryonic polyadenylate-binding protein 2 [Phyllostomus discolor]